MTCAIKESGASVLQSVEGSVSASVGDVDAGSAVSDGEGLGSVNVTGYLATALAAMDGCVILDGSSGDGSEV